MFSGRLSELTDIRNKAKIISPVLLNNTVTIGKIVVMRDENTGEIETYKIGSYMIFKMLHGYMSYSAPLAKIIIGAKTGDYQRRRNWREKRILKIITIV